MKKRRVIGKTSPRRIRAVQRQAEAIRLRAEGLNLTAIAARLGYRGKQGAHDAIVRGLAAVLRQPAETMRTLDLERLDALWQGVYLSACAGDSHATLACLRIMEHRARLLGLDAPRCVSSRQEHGFAGGVLVVRDLMSRSE